MWISVCPGAAFSTSVSSFLSQASGIVWLYPPPQEILRLQSAQPFYGYPRERVVSFAPGAGQPGLIAFYFRFFSPVTVLANLSSFHSLRSVTITGSALFSRLALPTPGPALASCAEVMLRSCIGQHTDARIPAASFNLGSRLGQGCLSRLLSRSLRTVTMFAAG
jgi:hypothetical protein